MHHVVSLFTASIVHRKVHRKMSNTYSNHKGIKSALRSLPDKGHNEIKDSTTTGLYLRVYSTGLSAFIHRYKIKGTRRVYTLPDIKLTKSNTEREIALALSEARSLHSTQKSLILQNIDPSIERDLKAKEIEAMPTVSRFSEIYIERYAKSKKKSWKSDKRYLDVEVTPVLGKLPLDKVKRSHIIALLDKKQDAGTMTVRNRLISLLSKFFNFAIERGLIEANPASGIKRTKETSKQRFLSEDEIRFLWGRTGDSSRYNPATRLAMRLILVTGQRPGEVCEMHEDQLKGKLWRMDDTKNGLPHSIPLTKLALKIIKEARPHARDGYLFANTKGVIMDKTILPKAMKRMPWADLPATPHDLRRTAITGISEWGYDRIIQNKIANHVDNSIGGIYDRHNYIKEKTSALEAWERKLKGILNQAKTDNVIPLTANHR